MPPGTAPPQGTLSDVLQWLAHEPGRERITMRDLIDVLGDRALGALMFFFAFPNVLPMPPGVSAVLGTPLVFLAVQLMFGQRPWLPAVMARRSMSHADFALLLRPRLVWLSQPPVEYLLGAVCLLLALVLALPIPLGNVLPALAISMLSLALLQRDGLWVLYGLALSVVATGVVSGVILAAVKALVFAASRLLP
jgi:hypothetical protein